MNITFIVLGIVIASILSFIFLRHKFWTREKFQEGPDSYIIESTANYDVKPYKECSDIVKKDVAKYLADEWKIETGIDYTEHFIEKTWKFPDALYVMTNKKGEFIGCSSVDHKYMKYPFISHIYVKKPYRKMGYGEKLFDVVLRHSKSVGHEKVYGFCKDELVPYYEGFGCKKEKTSWILKPFVGFNMMTKRL